MLPPDFKEFIERMILNNVQFVMIGGYAYNLYRNPRATGDIDFLVRCDPENETALRKTLVEFGFETAIPPAALPLLIEGKVIMLDRSPLRIDLLTRIDGVNFQEVYDQCRTIAIDGLPVPVISPEHLIKNHQVAQKTYWMRSS